ncbi:MULTISPECIES: glycosyltransferase [Microbacterium]|uniref:glycosyltransferase n=1 Tax=Microbacterium TaxID=33882 RepID=UPI00168AE8FA|nr:MULTISPECIES: glycosyltransferase [Microbacterium]QOC26161.1 glycosyltransferase family 2 protein [Microbacterium hominis]QYF97533.1 glycosyltransferase [Microbacterium sp. PAMC21962]
MPARVHALLVVRPDARVATDIRLERVLSALAAQSRPVDRLTIVLCGVHAGDRELQRIAGESGAEGVITADRGTSFADALDLASRRLDGEAVWILAQDTTPAPDALMRLLGALETSPSVAFAAPKLVRADDNDRIVSLGVSLTHGGRTVGLADGEHDQGQHDAGDDVLGADVRGILVRTDAWRALGGLDTALAGADEGLDLGVRARLRGGRVVLAPQAIVAIADADRSDPPALGDRFEPEGVRRAYAQRTAQLHRRLAYAPAAAVPLHWLSYLPLALLRSVALLLGKRPALIGPEWGATVTVMARPGAVARARRGIRAGRSVSWAQLAPLRITRAELRQRLDDDVVDGAARGELRFFSGGGAWIVLGALLVSVLAFLSLLAWPVLGGGALVPLRATVAQLWADAASGLRPLGWDTSGPADPFSAVIAVLGSLWPAAPSRVLVVVWVLALPLAALGAWFAATRVTERPLARALVAVGYALAPTLLGALASGRPTVVIAHLLLPWLLWTAAVAHRSWSAAGMGSVIAVAVLACAPSLAPAVVLLWVVAIVLTASLGRGRGIARVIWLLVPAVAVWAPMVWHRLDTGDPWALLADPGVPLASGEQVDLARRIAIAFGFPTTDAAGWDQLVAGIGPWALLLVVPLLGLAVAAPLLSRVVPAAVALVVAVSALATAMAVIGIEVTTDASVGIAVWPGAALSLYWLALLGAAALAVDAIPDAARVRMPLAVLAMAALAVSAVPALTALPRGTSALTDGPSSTLPAYVEAEGRAGLGNATFVLTPASDGAVVTDVVWGETSALGGQTTLRSARQGPDAGDAEAARLTAELLAAPSGSAVADLAAHGVAFVLLSGGGDGESDVARAVRIGAETALDQRDDLEIVGDTGRGKLWRVTGTVVDRQQTGGTAGAEVAVLQIGVIVIALLLALPTRRSLRLNRRRPRTVGLERGGAA